MPIKSSQESQKLLNSVKDFFNESKELAARRDEGKKGLSETEQAFVDKLPADSHLLDIGCATGRLCFALARRGYNVTGIDVAEKQIEQAQQIAEKEKINVKFLHYVPPTLPFSRWVVCSGIFDKNLLLRTASYGENCVFRGDCAGPQS